MTSHLVIILAVTKFENKRFFAKLTNILFSILSMEWNDFNGLILPWSFLARGKKSFCESNKRHFLVRYCSKPIFFCFEFPSILCKVKSLLHIAAWIRTQFPSLIYSFLAFLLVYVLSPPPASFAKKNVCVSR